jgi:DNA primase
MDNQKHSIAEYLAYLGAALPQQGHGWRKIKCPFHQDSHASAGVNFDEQRFKCHGCGVGGDVYDLIMEKEGGTYIEAIKFAESISLTGNRDIQSKHSSSNGLSSEQRVIGRRSSAISSRRSGTSIARSRRLHG